MVQRVYRDIRILLYLSAQWGGENEENSAMCLFSRGLWDGGKSFVDETIQEIVRPPLLITWLHAVSRIDIGRRASSR